MALQLSEKEKADLRELLSVPIMKKAIEDSLREVWRRKRGMETLEGAAMAYNHQSGASDFLDALYSLAEIKDTFHVPMRKLKH